ncbi:MAG: efflux RND transporter permease subunit [Kofleriaceae bacterium]
MSSRRAWPVLLVLLGACKHPSAGPPADAVRVSVAWRGASSAEVERDLLEPLEAAAAALADVVAMRGTAAARARDARAARRSGRVDALAAAARAAVAAVAPQVPVDAEPAVVARVRRDRAVVIATMSAGDVSAADLAPRFAALRDRLETLPGVDAVDVCGAQEPAVRITLDPAAVVARGLDAAAIWATLRASAWDLPRGGRAASDELAVEVDALTQRLVAPGIAVGDVGVVSVVMPYACAAVTAAGAGALIEVALRDRAAAAEVRAALRAAGAVPLARPPTVGVGALVGEPREGFAATLIAAGATVVRIDRATSTVEVVLDVDLASPAGEATLVQVEALAAQEAATAIRWAGPDVRALEAVVAAPASAPAATAQVAARIAAEAGTWPVVTPRAVASRAVTIDRARAATLGLSVAAIAQVLGLAGDGELVAVAPGDRARREVRLAWPALDDAALLALPIRSAAGELRRVGDVVTFTSQVEPDRILREDRRRVEIYWLRVPRGASVDAARQLLRRALPDARVRPAEPPAGR